MVSRLGSFENTFSLIYIKTPEPSLRDSGQENTMHRRILDPVQSSATSKLDLNDASVRKRR